MCSKLSQAQIFQGEIPPKFPHPKVQNGEFPPYESPKWGINPKIMKIEKKMLKNAVLCVKEHTGIKTRPLAGSDSPVVQF